MDINNKIKFIQNEEGKTTFVVLPIDVFEEIAEDHIDLKAIEERKDESYISLDELKEELKKDGKL